MQNCAKYKYLLLALGLFAIFTSCETVIDIDLNDVDPILIIEAEIGNDRDEQFVYISRSVAFSSSVSGEAVSGAQVTLEWNEDPLSSCMSCETKERTYEELWPGVYRLSSFRGRQEQTYTLRIVLEGASYEASSVMPQLVPIDSIGTIKSSIFGEDRKLVAVKYQDPEGIANYYRYQLIRNGQPMNTILVRNDKFSDGRMVEQSLFDMDVDFVSGDEIEIVQQSVSKEVHDFFNAILSNNPGTAAPANPPTMFGPGTIGYFSVYNADRATVEIE